MLTATAEVRGFASRLQLRDPVATARALLTALDAAHPDRVQEAQFVAAAEGEPEQRVLGDFFRRGGPLQAAAQHGVDQQVMAVDIKDEELAAAPDPLDGATLQFLGKVVGGSPQDETELGRDPDASDRLVGEAGREGLAPYLQLREVGHGGRV